MITVEFRGRHGNNIFQYACCRTIAEAKGFGFHVNLKDWKGYEMFDNIFPGAEGGESITKTYNETRYEYEPEIWNISDGTELKGYFQSELYFDNKKAQDWFILKHDPHAEELLRRYPTEEYCFVNLRGTDVKDLGCQKLGIHYYNQAKEVVRSVKSDIKFVVITDDTPFGKEYFPDLDVMTNSMHTDFTILNRAKYIILADSTFSWWAAWLNKKNFVVAPHGWLNVNVNKWIFAPKDIKVNRFIWI